MVSYINQSAPVIITTSAVKTIPRVGGRRGNTCSLCDSQPIIREDITEHTKLWCDSWTILVRGCGSWTGNDFLCLSPSVALKSGHITPTTISEHISGHLHYNTWM